MSTFVGRQSPVETMRGAIVDPNPKTRVRIVSVSGAGGVGKSYLINHVLSSLDPSQIKYLPLQVDGNTSSVTLTDVIARDLIATTDPNIAGDPRFFRVTREGWTLLQGMDARARAELESTVKEDDELAKMIGTIYEGSVGLLEIIPNKKLNKMGRVVKRVHGRDVERLITTIRRTKAYREEKGGLWGALPLRHAAKERNLLRKDLSGRLAEYLTIDLSAILSGYRSKDWRKFLPEKVKGLDRCLLILDDYETVGFSLNEFLKQDLLPRLRKTKFDTLVIVLGRDSLRDVDFAWDQYFGTELVDDIRLTPLSVEESETYLQSLGIVNPAVVERILRDSLGLPFLLAAEAELEARGGASAVALQKFVDRTTRWMTKDQRAWALAMAFLEEVNTDTVARILPDSDTSEIVEWFKREASLRSPESEKWSMLPLISSRMRAALANDSPSLYALYKERATKRGAVV